LLELPTDPRPAEQDYRGDVWIRLVDDLTTALRSLA
jgi:hypothetical protein